MSSIPPSTPVIVGVGQVLQRAADPTTASEPLTLMAEAAERAALDAGAPGLLARLDTIRVPHGLWRYTNPGAWLAERFGAHGARTQLGEISGTMVLKMLARASADISAGRSEVALIVGAEAEHSKRRAKKLGQLAPRTELPGPPPDEPPPPLPEFHGLSHVQAGLVDPTHCFGLYEVALRRRSGLDVEEHRRRIAELWARFSEVAATNPNAWIGEPMTAEAIASPTAANRVVASPYNKFMVANMVVDQGAAVIVCSAATARSMGIGEERWVFPWVCAHAEVGTELSERFAFDEEPTLRMVGQHALERSGLTPDDLGPIDLYSCFPSAVQLALAELGLPHEPTPTLTGGLTFGGGPFNSYVLHSLAQATDALRSDPSRPGLVTGVGGFMASHAAAILGGGPRPDGFEPHDLTEAAAELTGRTFVPDHTGPVEVESYVVPYREGRPDVALIAARTPDGGRCWARSQDAGLLDAMVAEEFCGRAGRVDADREFTT